MGSLLELKEYGIPVQLSALREGAAVTQAEFIEFCEGKYIVSLLKGEDLSKEVEPLPFKQFEVSESQASDICGICDRYRKKEKIAPPFFMDKKGVPYFEDSEVVK